MNWLLAVLYAALFFFLIVRYCRKNIKEFNPWFFGGAFLLKAASAVYLGILYINHFGGGDTYLFFWDSLKLFDALWSSPPGFFKVITGLYHEGEYENIFSTLGGWHNIDFIYNDTRTAIRFNALVRIFSFGNYEVHAVFFAMLSSIGMINLFRFFSGLIQKNYILIFSVLFLVPGVIFWTSGVLKEAILVFALGIFLNNAAMVFLHKKNRAMHWLWMVLSFLLFLHIKVYFLIAIVPAFLGLMWGYKTGFRKQLLKYAAVYLAFTGVVLSAKFVNPEWDVVKMVYYKNKNFEAYSRWSKTRNVIDVPLLKESAGDIILKLPRAFFNSVFQPLPSAKNIMVRNIAAVENLVLIFLLVLLATGISLKSPKDNSAMLFCFLTAILVLLLIGLTTPVPGTLIRYKAPVWIFLFMAVICCFENSFKKLCR